MTTTRSLRRFTLVGCYSTRPTGCAWARRNAWRCAWLDDHGIVTGVSRGFGAAVAAELLSTASHVGSAVIEVAADAGAAGPAVGEACHTGEAWRYEVSTSWWPPRPGRR